LWSFLLDGCFLLVAVMVAVGAFSAVLFLVAVLPFGLVAVLVAAAAMRSITDSL
jgi:hypothetical protein